MKDTISTTVIAAAAFITQFTNLDLFFKVLVGGLTVGFLSFKLWMAILNNIDAILNPRQYIADSRARRKQEQWLKSQNADNAD